MSTFKLLIDVSLTNDIPITSDLANRTWFQYASNLAEVMEACTEVPLVS